VTTAAQIFEIEIGFENKRVTVMLDDVTTRRLVTNFSAQHSVKAMYG
jgi:hypothetical protein